MDHVPIMVDMASAPHQASMPSQIRAGITRKNRANQLPRMPQAILHCTVYVMWCVPPGHC